jgi:hypothetical protein
MFPLNLKTYLSTPENSNVCWSFPLLSCFSFLSRTIFSGCTNCELLNLNNQRFHLSLLIIITRWILDMLK